MKKTRPRNDARDDSFGSERTGGGRRRTGRTAFTLIELMVTIAIIATVIGIVFVSLGETLTQAEEQKNKVGLSVVDAALQSRMEAFSDLVQRAEMGQGTGPVYLDVSLRANNLLSGYNSFGTNTPTTIDFNQARTFVLHELYRGLFPQRFEDMFGMDGVPSPLSDDDGGSIVNDDSPLLQLYVNQSSRFADLDTFATGYEDWAADNDQDATTGTAGPEYEAYFNELRSGTTSSELLVLFLTTQLGLSATPITTGDLGELASDQDGDGLLELRDTEGQPILFYNAPTRLVRPDGFGAPIDAIQAAQARKQINSLAKFDPEAYAVDNLNYLPADRAANRRKLPPANYDPDGSGIKRSTAMHPLNTDPYDRLRLLDGTFGGSTDISVVGYFGKTKASASDPDPTISPFIEKFYWTRNTYFTPLIVSAGADGEYGMQPPHTARKVSGVDAVDLGGDVDSDLEAGNARLGFVPADQRAALSDNITNRKRVLQ